MNTWLILDSNYICYRAYHAMGHLTHEGDMVGVIFGFFKDIIALQDQFATDKVIFCFDYGLGKREQLCQTYKATRRLNNETATPEEKAGKAEFRRQVARLREKYLRAVGFRNVFYAEGYEGDDVIASCCKNLQEGDDAVVVANDQDMWQLLAGNVICYSPTTRRTVTLQSFRKQWGLDPDQWVDIKALAGCSSDDVKGVKGVGETTAAKYLRGQLPAHYAAYKAIEANHRTWRRNLKLVTLPYPGCPVFTTQPDEVTAERWAYVADKLGFASIRGAAPTGTRSQRQATRQGFGIT